MSKTPTNSKNVEILKKTLTAVLAFVFILGITSSSMAQRNLNYHQLAMKNKQNPIHFDFIVLPGNSDSTVTFASVFSLSYNYLPFKKVQAPTENRQYYSTVSLSMEVFHSDKSRLRKKNRDDVSIQGLDLAGRTFWADTAYAKNYDQSQSKEEYLKGFLKVSLHPGIYSYVLQMKKGEETNSRLSKVQTRRIQSYPNMKVGNVIFGDKLVSRGSNQQLRISDMGSNVRYGKDFYALAYIPGYDANASYSLHINRLNIADEDTTKKGEVYSKELSDKDIKTHLIPTLGNDEESTLLDLKSTDKGYAYALVKIPNSNFPNSSYRFTIQKEGEKMPVTRSIFQSVWVDMPTSLLNLDTAIDMLHYIVDKETLKKISSGSRAEREKKFHEFWKKRDPTPNTEYNELMAEYYRRIDYAYEHFTTENTVGYKSDQGKVYIKYGPPQHTERKFPANGPTTEIWTYPNRTFVFKATSGFGDFKLVSEETK